MNAQLSASPSVVDGRRSPHQSVRLQRGARVQPAYGSAGRLEHFILDPQTREVTDLVVVFQGKEWVVPIEEVTGVQGDCVRLAGARREYETAPFRRTDYRSAGPEAPFGGPVRTARQGDEPLPEPATRSGRMPLSRLSAQECPLTAERPHQFALREQRLRIDKQRELAARLRVSRRIVERTRTLRVPIREEVAVLELISPDADDAIAVGDQTLRPGEPLELTLATERIHVSKERVALADVAVYKQVLQREQRIQERLRKEELEIDDPAKLAVETGPSLRPDQGGNMPGPPNGASRSVQRREASLRPSTAARVLAVTATLLSLIVSLRSSAGKTAPSNSA